MPAQLVVCFSCQGEFAESAATTTTHRYMSSTPGCWACYGEVLAREYSDRSFYEGDCIHKLTVDTYAVQHPGTPSQQSIRSVGYHLTRMYLIIERGISPDETQQAMVEISATKDKYYWLTPPSDLGAITVKDVHQTQSVADHKTMVRRWAVSVWQAWREHHDIVRGWAPR